MNIYVYHELLNMQNWICVTTTHWMTIVSIISEREEKFSLDYVHNGWIIFN